MSTGSGIEKYNATANEMNFATTDVLNMDVVDAIRTVLDSMPLPPPPVIFDGDKMASDAPVRVLLVSSEQYTSFVQSGNFRTLQSNAMARAAQAGQNPLFMGDAGLWNGILIVKMPKPIRFYAGDSILPTAPATPARWKRSPTRCRLPSARPTRWTAPSCWVARRWPRPGARTARPATPYFWSEKELDHGDKLEVLVGAVNGRSKIRFLIDHGDEQQFTDYGVMCFDTVVKIAQR
jgi:hypothetical protein